MARALTESSVSDRWSAIGFTLSLVLPSTMVVHRFLGPIGLIAYCLIASGLLLVLHRWGFARLLEAFTARRAAGLAAGLLMLLVVIFPLGYSIANSGLLGSGSDRDEHLTLGVTELLRGHYPYYPVGPLGGFISQMPGALILAIPFVLLGNGGYQNLFWLVLFAATLSVFWRDFRSAVLLVALILSCAPAVLREYLAGGDVLANGLYVLLFVMGMVHVIPQAHVGRWKKGLLVLALGIGLSSRAPFLLLLPLVYSALRRRAGARVAGSCVALVCAVFGLLTAPFYFYDPEGFTPMRTSEFMRFESIPPFGSALLLVVFAAIPLWLARDGDNGDTSTLLRRCALVLAVPVLTVTLLASIDSGRLESYYLGYGLWFLFFGAVGFRPSW